MPKLSRSPYRSHPRRARAPRPGVPGRWVVAGVLSVIVLMFSLLSVLSRTYRRTPADAPLPAAR